MSPASRVFVLLAALAPAACGHVPLGSLAQLSRINFETTDLSAFRAALRLPGALKPRPGGVHMDVIVKVSGEADQKTTFLLIETDPADLAGLPEAAPPGFSTYAYRLSSDDAARVDAIRAALIKNRRDGKGGSFGAGIAAKEFCLMGSLPPGPILSTTYLLTSETRSYITVTNTFDLRQEPKVEEELSKIGQC